MAGPLEGTAMVITAAAVLVCALDLLGRPMPPIVLLDTRPPDVSANAEGFVRRNPDTIYVLTKTAAFEDARHGDLHALRKIASILVHEAWHLRHGADETGAYRAQLIELLRLGETPDRWTYRAVATAWRFVERSRPRAEGVLASTR